MGYPIQLKKAVIEKVLQGNKQHHEIATIEKEIAEDGISIVDHSVVIDVVGAATDDLKIVKSTISGK